jgi:hypothetical protein
MILEAQNESDPGDWTAEERALVEWFQEALAARALPLEPFEFHAGVHVYNPSLMYGDLLIDINAGPRGPRGHMGTIIDDLRRLREFADARSREAQPVSPLPHDLFAEPGEVQAPPQEKKVRGLRLFA